MKLPASGIGGGGGRSLGPRLWQCSGETSHRTGLKLVHGEGEVNLEKFMCSCDSHMIDLFYHGHCRFANDTKPANHH